MNQKQSDKPSRRQQILEVLASELENSPGERITTAGLARAVGVSEAALYRHFPSKARMFEGLIEFIEDSIFGLINRILEDQKSAIRRSEHIMTLVLGFAAKNAGITRRGQPEAFSEKTGKPDIRGAYGLHGREMIA